MSQLFLLNFPNTTFYERL